MPFLIILACILLFTSLALSLKVKVTIEYKDELSLYVSTLFVKAKILPKKEKKRGPHSMSKSRAEKIRRKLREKAQKKKQRQLAKKASKKQEKTGEKSKRSFEDILDVISAVKDIVSTTIGKFFGHLRVDIARFHINIATGDAATTAIAYGAVCDALLHLFCILEPLRGFDLPKTKDISVQADYLSEQTTADIKLTLSIRVWHTLHIAIATLIKVIAHMDKFKPKDEDLPKGHKNKTA